MRVSVRVGTDPTTRPLLLLNGIGAPLELWEPLRERLAHRTTVAFDVPHGDHAHHYTTELANGGYLPRIAPGRFGADLSWALGGWRASLGAVRYLEQDRVAQNEEASPAYTLVDAHLAYRWDRSAGNSWEVFLDGSNLGNEEVRPHTSLLRDYAPLPGRAVAFGIRAWF